MSEPLHHVEEMLAHQEQQISDLSDMVSRQWQEIDCLKKLLRHLQNKIDGGEGAQGEQKTLSVTEQSAQDKPPHY